MNQQVAIADCRSAIQKVASQQEPNSGRRVPFQLLIGNWQLSFAVAALMLAAPAQAQRTNRPPEAGGQVYQLGMPPIWKGSAGASFGWYRPGEVDLLTVYANAGDSEGSAESDRRHRGYRFRGLRGLPRQRRLRWRSPGSLLDSHPRISASVPTTTFPTARPTCCSGSSWAPVAAACSAPGPCSASTGSRRATVPSASASRCRSGAGTTEQTRPQRDAVELEQPPVKRIAGPEDPALVLALGNLQERAVVDRAPDDSADRAGWRAGEGLRLRPRYAEGPARRRPRALRRAAGMARGARRGLLDGPGFPWACDDAGQDHGPGSARSAARRGAAAVQCLAWTAEGEGGPGHLCRRGPFRVRAVADPGPARPGGRSSPRRRVRVPGRRGCRGGRSRLPGKTLGGFAPGVAPAPARAPGKRLRQPVRDGPADRARDRRPVHAREPAQLRDERELSARVRPFRPGGADLSRALDPRLPREERGEAAR